MNISVLYAHEWAHYTSTLSCFTKKGLLSSQASSKWHHTTERVNIYDFLWPSQDKVSTVFVSPPIYVPISTRTHIRYNEKTEIDKYSLSQQFSSIYSLSPLYSQGSVLNPWTLK